eukprot:4117000-Ditylum_brightwellii.AAC.1
MKCKLVDTEKGNFNLVETILKGDAFTHWLKCRHTPIGNAQSDVYGLPARAHEMLFPKEFGSPAEILPL